MDQLADGQEEAIEAAVAVQLDLAESLPAHPDDADALKLPEGQPHLRADLGGKVGQLKEPPKGRPEHPVMVHVVGELFEHAGGPAPGA